MARKSMVFFVMLLVGSMSSAGSAQDVAAPRNGEVLRWSSPRAQVRPSSGTPAPRGTTGGSAVVIPATSPLARTNPFDVVPVAAEQSLSDGDSGETPSVLKRKSAAEANRGGGTGRSATDVDVPVVVAARRLGGGGTPTNTASEPVTPAAPAETATENVPAQPRVSGPTTGGKLPASPASRPLALRCPSPTLVVESLGPKSVTVGRPANFSVSVHNPGAETATNVEVRVAIPEWIEVTTMQAGMGEVSRPEATETMPADGSVVWLLPEVAPNGRVELVLQVIPRENRGFELGLQWSVAPSSVTAAIAVQQPELALSVAGPKDAKFGDSVTLLITVANPGTGDAENVNVNLTTGSNAPELIPVGLIPAGQQKQIEVQMTANQPGTIAITSEATAEGDIRAENATELLVRRAELQVVVSAPEKAFTGSPVTYEVRLSNTGTAAADDATVHIALPVGAKLEATTEGSQSTDTGLVWRAGSLPPGIERVYEIQCELSTAGENRLEAKVNAAGGISVAHSGVTEVLALADLKLSVAEPQGARRVGEEVVYEVTVVNRGSKAAESIQVFVQFSEGIEPIATEGGSAELAEGQAVFEPIARLGAGQKAILKVRAKAGQAGNHRFRIQVLGDNGETQLVSEGTTRFFGDAAKSGSSNSPANGATTDSSDDQRTASAASGRPTPARR